MDAFSDRNCVVITDMGQMVALEAEWNALWRKARGSFHQSYSFALHSWNEIAAPGGRSLFCIVIRERGRLVLVFPLVRYRKGPCRMIRPLGPNASETTDMLVDPDCDAETYARMAWRAVEDLSKADIVHMPFVRAGSVLDRLIRCGRSVGEADVAPFADLQDQTDWATYTRIIGANSRQQLNRKRKRLSELGEFEFVAVDPVTEPDYATDLMEWMFAHKKDWAERVGKHGDWITAPEYRKFLYKWMTDPANIQQMRVYAILIDKVPIAIKLVSFCASHVDLNIAGFHPDPQYAKYSPGFVLDEFWMKIVFEKRLNVDFGVGNEPYKLFWARDARADVASYHIPQTLIGSTATQLWRLKRIAEERMGERKARQAEPAKAA